MCGGSLKEEMCSYSCPAGNPGGTAEHSGGSTVGELQAETSRLTADLTLLREEVDRKPALQQNAAMQICSFSCLSSCALLLRFSSGPAANDSCPRHIFT